ncbi:DUF6415 family natural product biosynthesis protein [Streptantibioticus ferralitis]|uniref:DUF6415 family natural product biosynthesis protein n=1 Tax=Streptantibioticus ferralitis TaxID=236510 RepID=A0ABT5Z232_9ACTN|nr:DUF6415 family natural product biosynthesis protein [Streptantibioticus ferralitis]MDF2257901.1 DUF6415 family natural product biosynthesis protein [Streptantibioticus ferralitis]
MDVQTIAETVDAVLGERAVYPRYEEIEDLVLCLRGHIMLLIPEVETLACAQPKDDLVRALALAGIGEARRKLRGDAGTGLASAVVHAEQLACACRALLLHHKRLTA